MSRIFIPGPAGIATTYRKAYSYVYLLIVWIPANYLLYAYNAVVNE